MALTKETQPVSTTSFSITAPVGVTDEEIWAEIDQLQWSPGESRTLPCGALVTCTGTKEYGNCIDWE